MRYNKEVHVALLSGPLETNQPTDWLRETPPLGPPPEMRERAARSRSRRFDVV